MLTSETASFDLLIDQRHFHCIALKDITGYALAEYWGGVGNVVAPSAQRDVSHQYFEIQHRQLISEIAYPRGELLNVVSASHDGKAPYRYDVIAMRMDFKAGRYFVLAFPFATLAREVVDNLIRTRNLRKNCDILKVDLASLIRHHEPKQAEWDNGDVSRSEVGQIRTEVVGLHVVVTGDPALNSLIVGGDQPLYSSIYRGFLRDLIHGRPRKANLEQCTLACELQRAVPGRDELDLGPRKARARMHLDAFGNFKFYAHIGGENFVALPYMIQRLDSLGCLSTVSVNPLDRLTRDQETE